MTQKTLSISEQALAALHRSPAPSLHLPNRQDVITPETKSLADTYSAGLRSLVYVDYLKSRSFKRDQSRADWRGVDPDLKEWALRFVNRCAKMGIPLYVHTAYRSPKEQTEKYVTGRSKAKAGQSPHQAGYAVDIVHGVLAWNMTEKQWLILNHISKEIKASKPIDIQWLGEGSFYDPAHYQIRYWRNKIDQTQRGGV